MKSFIPEEMHIYAPNSVTFENKELVKIYGNDRGLDYSTLVIMIESCNNETYHGECKT